MEIEDVLGIVPQQVAGKEIIAEASITTESENDADSHYEQSRDRLLNVNNWHKVAGFVSAGFTLFNSDGTPVDRNVQQGDYIRINIPGPGSVEGEGYDWVIVEALSEISNYELCCTGFRVRPSAKPNSSGHIAHFYHEEATSSFMVARQQRKVLATIIDRNLQPNNDTQGLTDKVRHTAIAMGAISMFSKAQWQNLVNGFVQRQ